MSNQIPVKAIANGYYGGKVRVPGETFGIDKPEDFSISWMETDDKKVLSFVRSQAKAKPEKPEGVVVPATASVDRQRAVESRAARHQDWLDERKHADDDDDFVETRRVNTGGTDGVVGAEIPKAGQKLSTKERIAAAQSLTGRSDITSAKEADQILAAAQAGGSDNDDRSRDVAVDRANDAPLPAEDDV